MAQAEVTITDLGMMSVSTCLHQSSGIVTGGHSIHLKLPFLAQEGRKTGAMPVGTSAHGYHQALLLKDGS